MFRRREFTPREIWEKSMSTPRARVRSPIILQTNINNCSYPLHIHDLLISSIRMHLDTNSVCLGSSTGASVDAFLKHNECHFFYWSMWYLCTVCTHISYLAFAFCPWAAVVGFVVPAFRAISTRFCVVLLSNKKFKKFQRLVGRSGCARVEKFITERYEWLHTWTSGLMK